MILQIENTNICNASCTFCAHKYMKRPQRTMEQSVFEKIIDDCKNTKNGLEGIFMTGLGEPLLDPNIVGRVRLIKKKLNLPVTIYTNGTNLKLHLDALLSVGLDTLYLSLNAVSAEKRKSIMGIDNFNYLDNLIKTWNNKKCRLLVSSVCDWGLMECGDHAQMYDMYGGENVVYLHYAANWTGKLFDLKFKPINACKRPFEMIHVLNDGRIALCCLDIDGDVILGNSINEALNSEKLRFYRQKMVEGKRSELELCKNCTTV